MKTIWEQTSQLQIDCLILSKIHKPRLQDCCQIDLTGSWFVFQIIGKVSPSCLAPSLSSSYSHSAKIKEQIHWDIVARKPTNFCPKHKYNFLFYKSLVNYCHRWYIGSFSMTCMAAFYVLFTF